MHHAGLRSPAATSSQMPVSQMPVSLLPVSLLPVPQMPVSQMPVSLMPVSQMPVSLMPVSLMPVSLMPVSLMPVSLMPVSLIAAALAVLAGACGSPDASGPADASDAAGATKGPIAVVAGDRVGYAVVDMTPTLLETYTDTNQNGKFDGCPDDPGATGKKCAEPFDDANGNGVFDTAFIAGFGGGRAATGSHDPITARAVALSHGESYLVFVSLDVVGLGGDHIQKAQAQLAELGFDASRIIVSSTHTHQGPDVRGMWGSLEPGRMFSGANPAYNVKVRAAIVDVVQQAAAALEPAELRVGAVRMRDRSPWFNGADFGGTNPKAPVQGLIRDIRDPIVVSDQVLTFQARRADGSSIATWVGFAGHPEMVGSDNTLLSADYVWGVRKRLEDKLGGGAIFMAECLGGMQSGLGAPTPLVDAAGDWVYETQGGSQVPKWAPEDTFELAWSYGVHIADAALAALQTADAMALDALQVNRVSFLAPPDNFELQLMFELGLFDLDPEMTVRDATCPGWDPNDTEAPGCLLQWVYRVRAGPLEMVSAPGELFPELFWGFPVDPRWTEESVDPTKRGQDRGSVYFPQHDADCDTVPWFDTCRLQQIAGDCDCMSMHDVPYRLGVDEPKPVAELITAKYKFLIGNGGEHVGYILPESDFHRASTQLGGNNGDHYEETVSLTFQMATLWRATIDILMAQ